MALELASGSKEIVTWKGALPGNWQGFFCGCGEVMASFIWKLNEMLRRVFRPLGEVLAVVAVICGHPCLCCGVFAGVRPPDEL